MLALPLSLDGVGEVLDISEKSSRKAPTWSDTSPFHASRPRQTKEEPETCRNTRLRKKWELFKTYCIRDVDAEREIKVETQEFSDSRKPEMELYRLDQEINDRGIMVDRDLVSHAVKCDLRYKDMVTAQAYELTGLNNPNSVTQIKEWLMDRGVEVESLDKKSVKGLIPETDGEVLEVLKLRLLMAKTSIKKYEAIERSVCSDGRVHGLLSFMGRIGQDVGQEGLSRFRTCHRTIWRIWLLPEAL